MKTIDFALLLLARIGESKLTFTEIQVLLELAAGQKDNQQIADNQNINCSVVTAAAKRLERMRLVRCLSRTPGVYRLSDIGANLAASFFKS